MRWPLVRVAVSGPSMLPSLAPGEWWIALRTRRLRPGDLVVFEPPRRPGTLAVKRADHRTTGGWWVLGDNAAVSTDSRQEGPVPVSAIVGRLWWRYRPLPPRRPFHDPNGPRG